MDATARLPKTWRTTDGLPRAAFLLGAGSMVLLLGAIAFARGGLAGCGLLLAATWFATIFHGLGWYLLYGEGADGSTGRGVHTIGASVVLFLAGLVAIAALSPVEMDLLLLAFPYVPLLFAPVVLVHASVFLSLANGLTKGTEGTLVRLGAIALIVPAILGLAGQAAHAAVGAGTLAEALGAEEARQLMLWTFFPYPAGLTVFGYALVWWGTSAHARRSRSEGGPVGAPQGVP